MKTFFDKILVPFLKIYYVLKVTLYRSVVGQYAPAEVLYKCLRPEIMLPIYGAKVGKNLRIHRSVILYAINKDFSDLTIGDNVHIGRNAFIDLHGKVTIGDRVTIGMYSRIYSHMKVGDSNLKERYPMLKGDIVIPDDTVIGTGAMILYPFSITSGTLITAGSVVHGHYTKPCVLAGNPARQTLLRSVKTDVPLTKSGMYESD
jgi:acetyltransferase-like isoleucine patch superfamily enzyme